mmetsp:Transcript_23291/g.53648  ORF Transcript_23291/g.53648 Transcript_23291/m.53648 type:complete len:355 (+) Transcript_23291:961-2025(+)
MPFRTFPFSDTASPAASSQKTTGKSTSSPVVLDSLLIVRVSPHLTIRPVAPCAFACLAAFAMFTLSLTTATQPWKPSPLFFGGWYCPCSFAATTCPRKSLVSCSSVVHAADRASSFLTSLLFHKLFTNMVQSPCCNTSSSGSIISDMSGISRVKAISGLVMRPFPTTSPSGVTLRYLSSAPAPAVERGRGFKQMWLPDRIVPSCFFKPIPTRSMMKSCTSSGLALFLHNPLPSASNSMKFWLIPFNVTTSPSFSGPPPATALFRLSPSTLSPFRSSIQYFQASPPPPALSSPSSPPNKCSCVTWDLKLTILPLLMGLPPLSIENCVSGSAERPTPSQCPSLCTRSKFPVASDLT